MNLSKKQIYIISGLVIIAVIYFVFFHKKKTPVVAMAPAPKAGESGYFGEQWNWGSGPQQVTGANEMLIARGSVDNSVAGTMDSGYASSNNAWPRGGESGYSAEEMAKMRRVGSATNFLNF